MTQHAVVRPPAINKTLRAAQPISTSQAQVVAQLAAFAATPEPVMPTQEEDAVVRAANVAEVPDLPPYQIYTVSEGDTISAIGARFGISAEFIVANNAEIQNSDVLVLGQSLIIPAGNGVLHEVRLGETLSDIADRYGVGIDAISGFRSNGIASADDIAETQLVFVPGATLPAVSAEPVAEELPTDAVGDDDSGSDDGGGGSSSPGQVSTGPSSSAGLMWPVVGPISSYMGGGHPLGIDIDGFNLGGAAVGAATSGTVIFAGGNACCSYGLYVVVMSPDGIETLYAHLNSIYVSQGETVSQGQALGVIGDSGYSTGVHLHFEVIDNGVRVNPLSYLP